MNQYDSIVIGGGHNGLVCAAYLAKSGQRVLLLERQSETGGLAADREFHPGFRAAAAHSTAHFSASVADDLGLNKTQLSLNTNAIKTVGLDSEQNHVEISGSTVTGVSVKDTAAYDSYIDLMRQCANILAPFWGKTMPRIGSRKLADIATFAKLGLKMRLSGKETMREFLRIASLPMRDLMDESFDGDTLKAALCWDGLIGARMAPRSPNSAVLAMLYRMSEASLGQHSVPVGGIRTLVKALRESAESFGVEIRCSANVERVVIDATENGQRANGVQLASGEVINSQFVIAATDPKTAFLNLVGVEHLDIGFSNQIRRLRCDGLVGKLHLALDSEPHFPGLANCSGRMIIAPGMDQIEFAFDNAKYGELPDDPVMEVLVPSLSDPALAPQGKHVLSAHVMYVPYALKNGWNDSARNEMCGRAIATLEQYVPGIRQQIIHSEFLTPKDIETHYHVTGGHWHHTEFAMDQLLMMRPTYGAAQYRTPIPGLYLSSAGCHPGGDLSGLAGQNAAREILR